MSGSAVEPDAAFDRRLEIRKPTYDKNVGRVPQLNPPLRLIVGEIHKPTYDRNVGQVPQLNLTLRLIVGLKYASRLTTKM